MHGNSLCDLRTSITASVSGKSVSVLSLLCPYTVQEVYCVCEQSSVLEVYCVSGQSTVQEVYCVLCKLTIQYSRHTVSVLFTVQVYSVLCKNTVYCVSVLCTV